ncbi:MAG TPA: M20/M25/M40 family metallo-hydrolase [Candidatus Acidoferrum sp.]|jgi:acetylornithine deacetylase/succinyl-diaminopimelate desuccinylase-like protein
MPRQLIWLSVAALAFLFPGDANSRSQDHGNDLARGIFKQLVEINTTDSVGNVTTAAEAMAKRLLSAGFDPKDVIVDGPNDRKKNLVVRLHGTGPRKPVLFLAHLDVVEARREDWTTDPFQFIEKDGYFYGRGTVDIKDGAAILVANFMRLKKENWTPDRDLILALTADEEGGNFNGVEWLLRHHRDWIDAEYCVNLDGGDFMSNKGRKIYGAVQASEKVYVDFQLETKNPGGHSSRPTPDNAIYQLSKGLVRLADFKFPVEQNEITRSMLEKSAAIEGGSYAADMAAAAKSPPDPAALARLSTNPFYNAILRTTCVATMLSGGHAPNALPQTARANVNCRILPGQDPNKIKQTLERVVADPQIRVTFVEQRDADGNVVLPERVPPSPLRPDVMRAVESAAKAQWGALPIMPVMDTGASDGRFLRTAGIPTYGISGVFLDLDNRRAHGQDERLRTTDFDEGTDFNYKLIRALSK